MLRQSLTYQLASISEDAIRLGAALYKRRFGLDIHALRVLRLIDDEPGITFTTLAERTKFERSATSRILSRLVKHALVRRRIDSKDARQFRLYATPKAKSLRTEADPLSLELEALMLAPLRDDERRQFRAMLTRISNWVTGEFVGEVQRRYPLPRGTRGAKPAVGEGRPARVSKASDR
jgi:DNA-binding MarR family transcriptional regulator